MATPSMARLAMTCLATTCLALFALPALSAFPGGDPTADDLPSVRVQPLPAPGGPAAVYPTAVTYDDVVPPGDKPTSFSVACWIEGGTDGPFAVHVAGILGAHAPDEIGSEPWMALPPAPVSAEGFVNWADFPSVAVGGTFWLSWLERTAEGYAPRVASLTADDDPMTREGYDPEHARWTEPRWLPAVVKGPEAGFVSLVPMATQHGGGCLAVWLDGRGMTAGDHGHGGGEMQLRAALLDGNATPGPEVVLDERACECCQTDAALLPDGRAIVVWRDRGDDEVRDVAYAVGDPRDPESWSTPALVSADGWRIDGCPVNGPAVATAGGRAAVAWFTAGGERSEVRLALAEDVGPGLGEPGFADPVRVDLGAPVGRADVHWLTGGETGIVTWLEFADEGSGAVWHARAFDRQGRLGPPAEVAEVAGGRASGFLRTAPQVDRSVLALWTGDDGLGAARLALVD